MSLPNYLSKIKSSGIYRYVFDKSLVPQQESETLRLMVGYSDKGPFNTPVYIETSDDFINTFGNINKKLERKGIFFHRLCLQALSAGPILALNLKPFNEETVSYTTFNVSDIFNATPLTTNTKAVNSLYNTDRFWSLDFDELPTKVENSDKYITLASTDNKDLSCTVFFRKSDTTGYDLTIREWFANNPDEEIPEYLNTILDENLSDYFLDVYVFRGKFTPELCKEGGPFGYKDSEGKWTGYFVVDDDNVYLNADYKDIFGADADPLDALAGNVSSNYIAKYQGCTIPYFKDGNGNYISLDILFNNDHATHKMLMKMNEELLYDNDETNTLIKTSGPKYQFTDDSYINVSYKVNEKNTINGIDVIDFGTVNVGEARDIILNIESLNPDNASTYYLNRINNYSSPQNLTLTIIDPITGGDISGNSDTSINQSRVELKISIQAGTLGSFETYVSCTASYCIDQEFRTVTKRIYIKGNVVQSSTSQAAEVTTSETGNGTVLYVNSTTDVKSIIRSIENTSVYLEGFQYVTLDKLSGNDLIKKILSVTKETGIREALTNRVSVDYHYLVDTFKSFGVNNCKVELSAIAKYKDNAFAILNYPARADLTVTSTVSLPTDEFGASWAGYFTPVVFSDGAVKYTVPSAGLVSNNFMDKWSSRQPYYIVAGPTYGRLNYQNLVGPDYNYSRKDLDVLEPMGVNAIIYVPRKGTYINSNQTAKQNPVTALSKIHVRELVIYLQDTIESMLQNYQWELNTQTLRDTIKSKADSILENVMNNGGVYAYTNVCDETNNTTEVIDNEMIILDTAIEPARGAGKMVQRLTIHKTGGITSSSI